MSGLSAPSIKLSLRQRIRGFRSRSRASSPSPSPSPLPSPSPNLETHVITSQSPVSSSSAVLVTANPPNAGAVHPLSQQVTSPPFTSHDILNRALQLLSDSDRTVLQVYTSSKTSDVTLALEQALAAAMEKQRCCNEKRWKIIFNGRTVILKEEADKVISWLDRFKAVGDVAANANPVHAGLPWAGIRLLLEAATSEVNQMASLLVGCKTALYLANRLKAYIEFMNILPATLTRDNFEHAVTEMYSYILRFLAQAIQIYQKSTFQRALTAFWQMSDVQDFETKCDQLGGRVEIEASNCDRTVNAQDRESIIESQRDLQKTLKELIQHHKVQESIDRLGSKIDLDKLPCAAEAIYNSWTNNVHVNCHPATRVDILRQVKDWARQPDSKLIFWLNGAAGTGKSTISHTVAEWLTNQGDLGASFFFRRGESDRGSALRFFPTITNQLRLKIPELCTLIAEVINSDPFICNKSLGEQFDKLIYQPLQKVQLTASSGSTFIVVVDALDECEKNTEVKAILQLWSRLTRITNICLRLFLTSRPDSPVHLGFNTIPISAHQDLILDEVPPATIQHDIYMFLKDEFSKIREEHNNDPLSGIPLDNDWPGEKVLQNLADRAVPLFIVAVTICRFVGGPNPDPRGALEEILNFQGMGEMRLIAQTYLPVLKRLSTISSDSYKKETLHRDFQTIVGSIIVLADPLSVASLETLLKVSRATINFLLRSLHSVLQVPSDLTIPVRTLHLSFSEYLVGDTLRGQPFGVDGPATHRMLLTRCLELLSSRHGLRENICELNYPGHPRQEIDSTTIRECLSPALQYACRYWVHHAQQSEIQIQDNDEVHVFLQKHFLHWFEALSLIRPSAAAVGYIGVLQSLLSSDDSNNLSSFLEDAHRFILANRYVADLAPLQIYSSAIIFAPQSSIVRNVCGRTPAWIKQVPMPSAVWGPELQKLEGHTHGVMAVAFSQDSSLLASASTDHTVRLWNPMTGQELQKLDGHTDSVNAVAFSQDSSLLASASWDQTVRLWNPTTGQEVQKLDGHTDSVNAVAFSQDGSLLASASYDQTVRLWNPTTGQEVQKLDGHTSAVNAVAFSQDDSLLASASYDQTVRLWNPTTGQEVQKLDGHTNEVYTVAFSQDGSLLASVLSNHTIRLLDPATGQELQKLDGHTSAVNAVAFSQDDSLLASASYDQTVRLWNPTTGQEVQKLDGHTNEVNTVAFSQDGSLLASASSEQTVRLWNPTTGQEVQKLDGHTGAVSAVAFSQDGSLLASASYNQIVRLWNPMTGQEVQKLDGHTNRVNAVAFSQDGSLLASASLDQMVRLWNPTTGQEVQKLDGHTHGAIAVAFSQDGSLLASASYDQTVRLWNPTTGQEVQKLDGHTESVNAVAFSQDGSLLASASHDDTVRLWNLITGQEVQKLEGHTHGVMAVAFSQDGSLLASASLDHTVRLWNPTTGQEVQKLDGHTDSVNAVAFSQDGSLLASASWDQTVRLWNPTTGQEVQKLDGHTDSVNAVAFSQDSSLLASASADQTVRLWNPTTGQEVQKLDGHTDAVIAVAFSQDGLLFASVSSEQMVRLWNPMTGQEVQKLDGHTNKVNTVAFSQDGSLLASASADYTVRLWNPMTGQEVQKLDGHTNSVNAVAFSQDSSLLASASADQTVRLWNPTTGQEVQKWEDIPEVWTISPTSDNMTWITNRGLIDMNKGHGSVTDSECNRNNTHVLNGAWIRQDFRNLLWLPHGYRGSCIEFYGGLFAIGQHSGQVSFIRLSYSE